MQDAGTVSLNRTRATTHHCNANFGGAVSFQIALAANIYRYVQTEHSAAGSDCEVSTDTELTDSRRCVCGGNANKFNNIYTLLLVLSAIMQILLLYKQ